MRLTTLKFSTILTIKSIIYSSLSFCLKKIKKKKAKRIKTLRVGGPL